METDRLNANDARMAIYDFADNFSWETVAKEIIQQMSGDEARSFVEYFNTHFVEE